MPGEQVGAAFAKISLDSKELDSGMSAAHGRFSSFAGGLESRAASAGKSIGSAIATGAVAAGVALAGVATIGVKSYMDIESAAADAASKMDLGEIAQKSGKTVGEAFLGIKEHVMALSDELGQLSTNAFDPTQIATALAGLAAGGFDVASASAANLSPILSLATATNYDLADSAKLAMSTLNQFGMSVDDLGRVSDVYSTASGKSAAGMKDFDYAMQQAGPVAKGVGMSFEELTARVSKLADAGYGGEKSGTALRTAMLKLAKDTPELSKSLAEVGLTYADVDPRAHTFSETLDLLLSKGADIYDFGKIYGDEGAAIVYSTAQQNSAVKDLTNTLETCQGSAEQMAKLMLDNLKGSMDAAMGAASSLAYLIGGKLAPSLESAFEWFSSTGAPAIREFITAISDGDWASVGDQIAAGVEAGWAKLKDLGGQLFGWIKNVDWGALGDYVTKGISAAWDELKSLGSDLLDALLDVDWGGVGSAMLDAISTAIDSIIDYAGGIYDYFTDIDWGNVWDALVAAWDSAIGTLSDVGSTVLGYFTSVDWGTAGFKLGQAIRDAITKLADIGSIVWNYLTSADWSGAGSSITEKIKAGLEALSDVWEDFKAGLLAVDWGGAATNVAEKLKAGFKQVTDWATSIIDGIEKDFNDWITGGGPNTLGEDLAKAIVEGAKDLGEWIYEKVEAFWKGISGDGGSLGTTIYTTFKNIFTTLIDWAKLALTAAYDFVVGFADTIITAGKGTIGAAILEVIGDAMNSAWEGAGDGLIEQATQWRKEAEGIWEASDFDAALNVATSYLGGSDPSSLDGKSYSSNLNVVVTTTGEDITSQIKSKNLMPKMTEGHLGGMTYDSSSHEYSIRTTGASGNYEQSQTLPEWAKHLGESGATSKQVTDYLSSIDYENFPISSAYKEKIMAAFTAGQEEYDAAHKTAAEEAAEVTTAAAEEAAETTTEAAEEAAATTTEAANDAAATEKAAAQSLYQTLVGGSQAAANAIKIGAEIAAGSVKIGLNSAGQEIAIIGQVAQQRFAEAGGILYDKVQVAGSGFSTTIGGAATALSSRISAAVQDLSSKISSAGGNFQSKVDISGSNFKVGTASAITNLATKLGSGASDVLSKFNTAGSTILAGANSAKTSIISGGSSAGSALSAGASALVSAASSVRSIMNSAASTNTLKSIMPSSSSSTSSRTSTTTTSSSSSSSSSSEPDWWTSAYEAAGGHALGTKTTGPQFAMIGEDGSAYPEYVIPTKTKRWDLMFAAMRSYGLGSILRTLGIRGFAEGTSTGTDTGGVSADNGEASGVTATFGITGLAAMSKQVQKIINNLKDFFRISWAIVKSEASTYWRQINTVLTTEITSIRDMGWQAAIDIRNVWIASNAEIKTDALAFWAAYWAGIEPSVTSLKSSLVSAFQSMGSDAKSAIDNMVLNSESSLQSFESAWSDIWAQLVSDMNDAQAKISEGISTISDALKKISVNVNINANISSGGSSGGGSYSSGGGSVVSGGSSGSMQFTDCMFEGFTDECTGVLVNPLIYTNPSGVTSYINPMTYNSTGGISSYQGSGNSGGSSYSLPPIFAAKGALVDQPTKAILAEAGPEMVLPTKLTKMFLSLADMGFGQGGRSASERIVIEDHTEHHWYMDGKEVTDVLMTRVMKKMQLKGAIPAR